MIINVHASDHAVEAARERISALPQDPDACRRWIERLAHKALQGEKKPVKPGKKRSRRFKCVFCGYEYIFQNRNDGDFQLVTVIPVYLPHNKPYRRNRDGQV